MGKQYFAKVIESKGRPLLNIFDGREVGLDTLFELQEKGFRVVAGVGEFLVVEEIQKPSHLVREDDAILRRNQKLREEAKEEEESLDFILYEGNTPFSSPWEQREGWESKVVTPVYLFPLAPEGSESYFILGWEDEGPGGEL